MPFSRAHRRVRRRPRRRVRRQRRRRRRRVVMDPERKSLTIPFNGTVPITGVIINLGLINQGVSEFQRIGRSCVLTSLSVTFNFTNIVLDECTFVRLMLIFDKVPDGAQFTLADIFDTPLTPTTSPRNLRKAGRFRVLWSRRLFLDVHHPCKVVQLNKPLRITSTFTGSGAGIVDLSTGGLSILMVSNQAGVQAPGADLIHRVRFVG